jgi:hypothetical protein
VIDLQRLEQAGFSRLGCSGEPGHLRVGPLVSASSAAQKVAGTSVTVSLASCRAAVSWPWRASSFARAREAENLVLLAAAAEGFLDALGIGGADALVDRESLL